MPATASSLPYFLSDAPTSTPLSGIPMIEKDTPHDDHPGSKVLKARNILMWKVLF